MHSFLIFLISLVALVIPTTSWDASTSGNLAINVTAVNPATNAIESPGPSQTLYASPYYSCVTNYYVAMNGSSSNSGTSSNSPWDIVTAAGKSLVAGSCLNLATGVYPINGTLRINHGGTTASATGYVVWRCSALVLGFSSGALQGEGGGCVIRENSRGTADLISAQAPYVMFDGIEADGNNGTAFNNCLDGGPEGNSGNNTGNGTTTYHHLWFINGDVHGCGQSGIQWNGTEYLWIVHSVIHDNSWCSAGSYSTCTGSFGNYGSGISIYDPVGFASGAYTPTGAIGSSLPAQDNYWCATTPSSVCFHYIMAYNVVYHNYNSQTGQSNTDGEGIIFDDWEHAQNSCPGTGTCPITGAGLAMGNLLFWNGGQGIEASNGANVDQIWVVNNTAYNNNWDTHADIPLTYRGGIYNDGGGNVRMLNNIGYAVVGNGGNCSTSSGSAQLGCNTGFVDQHATNASVIQNNIGYPAGQNVGSPSSYLTMGTNKNGEVNPNLTSLNSSSAVNNFALQSGSSAIGFGQAFTLWQQSGSVDAGACVSSLTSCP